MIAEALVVLEIGEAERLLKDGTTPFTPDELAYARARSDPARRLAARLAAKRAAVIALGPPAREEEVEVVRGKGGPPRLVLTGGAAERLRALGATRALVSLTHERAHAAAAVLLVP